MTLNTVVAILTAGLSAMAAFGQTYDMVQGFSLAANPNGVWSYGHTTTLGGPLQLFTAAYVDVPWLVGTDRWCSTIFDPTILCATKNRTPNPIYSTTVVYPPDMLTIHPTVPAIFDVVRWTAPASGVYEIDAEFAGLDNVTSFASADVHVLENSTVELTPVVVLRGIGTQTALSISRFLLAGTTIDFVVGIGDNGAHQNDSVGVKATIVGLPPNPNGPIASIVNVSPNPLAINTASALSATVDDSATGGQAIAAAAFAVGNGPIAPMAIAPAGSTTVTATAVLPAITQTGVYSVCVNGTDSGGNAGAHTCTLVPVYDPNGGFVTGGGQITSPTGADLANSSASGTASFGFVSKYLPGRSTPSGNLEFQFKQGNLNFKSTSMDWLVVTGQPRAIFRGTGTVNGSNVCKFEVDAWDGSFQPGAKDAFGLKIYACANGGDRYNLAPVALTKGSIIIHE